MKDHETAPAKKRFQLLRGFGAQTKREADQLDRFLASCDPLLLAAPRGETPREPSSWRVVPVATALLLVLSVLPVSWLAFRQLRTSGVAEPGPTQDRRTGALLVAQARRQLAETRYSDALVSATHATRLAPDLAEAWVTLGDCHLKNYQSKLAERAFRKALALEPGSSKALLGLGALFMRQGDRRRAEQMWLQVGSDFKLAGLYLLEGKFHEAEIRLRPLMARGTEDELIFRMAEAARTRHLPPALRSLLEPEPTGRSDWAELGWRLARVGRSKEAEQAFRRAVAEVPDDVNALSGLGFSLLALGRTREAEPCFDRALALDGDHGLSLDGKARCLRNEGHFGEAIALWQSLARLYPGISYANQGLAWTYFETGNYPQAVIYLDRLVRHSPSDLRAANALSSAVRHLAAEPKPEGAPGG